MGRLYGIVEISPSKKEGGATVMFVHFHKKYRRFLFESAFNEKFGDFNARKNTAFCVGEKSRLEILYFGRGKIEK